MWECEFKDQLNHLDRLIQWTHSTFKYRTDPNDPKIRTPLILV